MRHVLLLSAVGLLAFSRCGNDGSGDSVAGTPPPFEDAASALFDESVLHDVALSMSAEDWDSIIDDSRGDDWRPVAFEWGGRRVEQVGARPSTAPRIAGNRKMSVWLKFDALVPGQRLLGLQHLKLDGLADDPSMMRDRLSYAVLRGRMPGGRSAHGRLTVNGEYRGVYELEEVIDGPFVLGRFGGALGNLYDMENTTVDPYDWQGPDPGLYIPFPWDPDTNELTADHTRVSHLIDVLNHDPARLGTICALDPLLEYFAVEAAIADQHGFAGDLLANNHSQYYRLETRVFHIIGRDFADTWGGGDEVPTRSIFQNFQNSRLSALVENDPALRAGYKQKIAEVIASLTHPDTIAARVDFIYFQIRDAAHADPNKPWTTEHFDWSRGFLKDFAVQRYASLQQQLAQP